MFILKLEQDMKPDQLTAQARFEEQFPDICLDWHDIYKLPFNVLIDTKSREFQYRILNMNVVTNVLILPLQFFK